MLNPTRRPSAVDMRTWRRILVLTVLVFLQMGVAPHILKLERANKDSHGNGMMDLSRLITRDRARHGRRLGSVHGVVDLPVQGDDFGLYFTKLRLGTPPKEFYVQIDSGSDVLWLSCARCSGCPRTSTLNIPLTLYDPGSSTTASPISCADEKCNSADSVCLPGTHQCGYKVRYGDESRTSGYYIQDLLNLPTTDGSSLISNTSASIVFGCSTLQTGKLTKPDVAVDGIIGLGPQDMSLISQLASQGAAPRAFSHCLKGGDGGGGILVLGQIVEPKMVYSPLVPSQYHYNLDLQSISMNGQVMPIDPAVFATSSNQDSGTIIDSGTTLAYLAKEAYDIFLDAISNAVAQSVQPFTYQGFVCYEISDSLDAIFPPVSFNFAGNASMFLRPEDYLFPQSIGRREVWCMGFKKFKRGRLTILGDIAVYTLCILGHSELDNHPIHYMRLISYSLADLVLKDKIIVYDIAGQRIGWVDYDCSSPVNVSTTTTSSAQGPFVTAQKISKGDLLQTAPYWLTASSLLIFLIHTSF